MQTCSLEEMGNKATQIIGCRRERFSDPDPCRCTIDHPTCQSAIPCYGLLLNLIVRQCNVARGYYGGRFSVKRLSKTDRLKWDLHKKSQASLRRPGIVIFRRT